MALVIRRIKWPWRSGFHNAESMDFFAAVHFFRRRRKAGRAGVSSRATSGSVSPGGWRCAGWNANIHRSTVLHSQFVKKADLYLTS